MKLIDIESEKNYLNKMIDKLEFGEPITEYDNLTSVEIPEYTKTSITAAYDDLGACPVSIKSSYSNEIDILHNEVKELKTQVKEMQNTIIQLNGICRALISSMEE